MEKEFVETLNITNVYQRKITEGRIDICFTVENRKYQLIVINYASSNNFEADLIYHKDDEDACSFCRNETTYCHTLFRYRDLIFNQLIECPSIRLEWLYIPHAVQA